MSNKDLYGFLIKELHCNKQKKDCVRNCEDCPLYTEVSVSDMCHGALIEILKSRDPELYFSNELDEIRSILGGIQSENPDNKNT